MDVFPDMKFAMTVESVESEDVKDIKESLSVVFSFSVTPNKVIKLQTVLSYNLDLIVNSEG